MCCLQTVSVILLIALTGQSTHHTKGLFYKQEVNQIPAWITTYIHQKVWIEMIRPFPNFTRWSVGMDK